MGRKWGLRNEGLPIWAGGFDWELLADGRDGFSRPGRSQIPSKERAKRSEPRRRRFM